MAFDIGNSKYWSSFVTEIEGDPPSLFRYDLVDINTLELVKGPVRDRPAAVASPGHHPLKKCLKGQDPSSRRSLLFEVACIDKDLLDLLELLSEFGILFY